MKALLRNLSLIALAVGLLAAPAKAFTVYTNSSDFLNAFTGARFTTNFASITSYQFLSNPSGFSGNGFSYNIYSTTNNPGQSDLVGLRTLPDQGWVSVFSDVDSLIFSNFVSPGGQGIFGIGGNWFINDAGGNFVSQQVTVAVTLADNSTFTTNYTPIDFASSYLGFIVSTNITKLEVDGPFPSVTDVYAGAGNVTVVPEPSTYALLGLAAAGLAGYVIRRRRA